VQGGSWRAGIVSFATDNTVIQDCVNEATIIDGGAGIVGMAQDSSIIRCVNKADFYNATGYAAGIVRYFDNNYLHAEECGIIDCENYGNITAWSIAAGIVVEMRSSGGGSTFTVSGCKNYGEITSLGPPAMDGDWIDFDNLSTERTAAGIIGLITTGRVNIDSCVNEGDITGNGNNVAGIIGSIGLFQADWGTANVSITNCANSGKITSTYTGTDTVYNSPNNPRQREGYAPDLISVGGIAGNLYGVYGTPYDLARPGTVILNGNANTGEISFGTAKNVGSIVGNLTPDDQRPAGSVITIDGNTTTVQGVGEKYPGSATYISPVVPTNPKNPTTNNGGGGSPATTAPRNLVRYTVPITSLDPPVIGILNTNNAADQALPETNVNSQNEQIGDLDVPTTVTAETQSNNVLPIALVVLIVIVAGALIFRGLRLRRKGAES
jgi:hypothetical protein